MSKKVLAPTKAYLNVVNKESITLKEARKDQLLILDLNGTLVSRNRKNKSMYVRPYAQEFFDYVFENFTVMLWSSAQPHSVKYMSRIFRHRRDKLVAVWDRTSLDLSTRDFNRKSLTIKDLNKVWKHFDGKYDATNTILLDDSHQKTILQPYNAIHPTEFEHHSTAFVSSGESELLHVMEYLRAIQFQSNIAWYIKRHPYHNLPKNNEKNIYKLEFYRFADNWENAPQIVDFTPVDNLLNDFSSIQIK